MPRGQTLAIIGESGCGKTVLLKTIIGLVRPTRGSVRVRRPGPGQPERAGADASSGLRFGFLFQQAALFDSMTIAQNVAFPLRQHRPHAAGGNRAQVVLARLAEVGLPETVVAKKPAELSGGMRKRVGLARALVMNPELMLYDEPTTGLDPIMSDVINELILRARHRYPVTSVVVTHDMRTARKVADRVVMLFPLLAVGAGRAADHFRRTAERARADQGSPRAQFVRGEAGERLMEMRQAAAAAGGLAHSE